MFHIFKGLLWINKSSTTTYLSINYWKKYTVYYLTIATANRTVRKLCLSRSDVDEPNLNFNNLCSCFCNLKIRIHTLLMLDERSRLDQHVSPRRVNRRDPPPPRLQIKPRLMLPRLQPLAPPRTAHPLFHPYRRNRLTWPFRSTPRFPVFQRHRRSHRRTPIYFTPRSIGQHSHQVWQFIGSFFLYVSLIFVLCRGEDGSPAKILRLRRWSFVMLTIRMDLPLRIVILIPCVCLILD